ncbi:Protein R11G1.2 [Aphelenchoides avenae]|nr:Protein R11G1.2 [Aphelenchus avenae]
MSASTVARLSVYVLMLALAANAITVEDVYKRLLERERTAGSNPFSGHFIRPIGSVGDELIWPRTYGRPSALFFDENGASYNVRPERPSLTHILRRTPLGGRYLNAVGEDY